MEFLDKLIFLTTMLVETALYCLIGNYVLYSVRFHCYTHSVIIISKPQRLLNGPNRLFLVIEAKTKIQKFLWYKDDRNLVLQKKANELIESFLTKIFYHKNISVKTFICSFSVQRSINQRIF